MTERESTKSLITNQNLKFILSTLMTALIILLKRLYDLDLEIEHLERENEDLARQNLKMNEILSKTENIGEANNYSFKFIGGAVCLILVFAIISYFGGIDPGQLGKGLNSVSNQNTDIAIESLKGLSNNISSVGDNILKGIEELEKVLQNLNKENNSWFDTISKQIAKSNITNTHDFFRGKKPPTFN